MEVGKKRSVLSRRLVYIYRVRHSLDTPQKNLFGSVIRFLHNQIPKYLGFEHVGT